LKLARANKFLSLFVAFALLVGFAAMTAPREVSFVHNASASGLGDNITAELNTWLPLIITMVFVVAILAMLGIKKLAK